MFPNFFDFFHIGRFLVASDYQVDQSQESPYYQCYMKHIVLVKGRVEFQVVDLKSEDHKDLSIVGIGRERTYAQLNHSHRSYQHQNHIEKEAIHPGLILFHRMQSTTTRNTNPELDCSLLNTPKDVQTKVSKYTSS